MGRQCCVIRLLWHCRLVQWAGLGPSNLNGVCRRIYLLFERVLLSGQVTETDEGVLKAYPELDIPRMTVQLAMFKSQFSYSFGIPNPSRSEGQSARNGSWSEKDVHSGGSGAACSSDVAMTSRVVVVWGRTLIQLSETTEDLVTQHDDAAASQLLSLSVTPTRKCWTTSQFQRLQQSLRNDRTFDVQSLATAHFKQCASFFSRVLSRGHSAYIGIVKDNYSFPVVCGAFDHFFCV